MQYERHRSKGCDAMSPTSLSTRLRTLTRAKHRRGLHTVAATIGVACLCGGFAQASSAASWPSYPYSVSELPFLSISGGNAIWYDRSVQLAGRINNPVGTPNDVCFYAYDSYGVHPVASNVASTCRWVGAHASRSFGFTMTPDVPHGIRTIDIWSLSSANGECLCETLNRP
jgi:hypothetical protein